MLMACQGSQHSNLRRLVHLVTCRLKLQAPVSKMITSVWSTQPCALAWSASLQASC